MRNGQTTEWIGGVISAPLYVLEGGPQRPDIVLWLELPSGLVVGTRLNAPRLSPDDVAATLADALERPLAPDASRPTHLRVGDDALATAVRMRLGDAIPITVAPTPELHVLAEDMARFLGKRGAGDGVTWLEGDRVPESVVRWLFSAAAQLWREGPWKVADDSQVLAVDVPEFGIQGACLSVIGALGQHFGFVLFDSLESFEAFAASAPPDGAAPTRPPDLRGYTLSLDFERRGDLPAAMRREIAAHRWPVAGPRAYPVVLCPDPDAVARPLSERDVRLAAACAEALASFTRRHRAAFGCDPVVPSREEIAAGPVGEQVVVRLRLPHPDAEATHAAPPMPLVRVGRNDPCPCGSGRKYKKCHLRLDHGQAAADPGERALSLHALDERLVEALLHFAAARFGERLDAVYDELDSLAPDLPNIHFVVPWLVYQHRFDGHSMVDWYVEARGARLAPSERAWLAAQRAAWVSVWEVLDVDPGATLTLRDLLTGEERVVRERSASLITVRRDTLLARVVDHDGVSLLCSTHPRVLRPSAAARVVRAARRALGTRARRLPPEALRTGATGKALAEAWRDAVGREDARRAAGIALHNTDGDPLLLTRDHFTFEPADRPAVDERLAPLGERDDDGGDGRTTLDVTEQRPNGVLRIVLVGHVLIDRHGLVLETNSLARADRLRRRIEDACGGLIRHRLREHTDPQSPAVRAAARRLPEPPRPPEATRLVLEFKRQHYASWPDERIPALGGLTPREAMGQAQARAKLDLLLRDMENGEARLPDAERYDFAALRTELGLRE